MSVQQTIIKGIREQLFFNNYLVLPGFGGFVLKVVPSHVSASGASLTPPSKTIGFNAQLKQNDGVLASWLQFVLKCNASEAAAHLREFAEFCASVLSARRRLSLEGIGFFYLDFENNICFEPRQDSNFLISSFGLTPVSISPLESVVTEHKKETVFVDRTVERTEPAVVPPRVRRHYSKIIIPVVFAILFIGLFGLLVNNSFIQGEIRSGLFSEPANGTYSRIDYGDLNINAAPPREFSYVADANGIATLKLDENKKIAVKAVESDWSNTHSKSSKSTHNQLSRSGGFEIVFGCFTILDNAKRMVRNLSARKIAAGVTRKNNKGMYVVSTGEYSSHEEAISDLADLKEKFPNAWIKKTD